jgi:hypothetical protein
MKIKSFIIFSFAIFVSVFYFVPKAHASNLLDAQPVGDQTLGGGSFHGVEQFFRGGMDDTPLDNNKPADVAMGTGSLSSDEGAKKLIEAISKDIESIYNTPAADKLRKIAEKKWYQPRWLIL